MEVLDYKIALMENETDEKFMNFDLSKCCYCGNDLESKSSKDFYGKDFGITIYICEPCDAYVGSHRENQKPLGTVANKELRELRKLCHYYFDPLWNGKGGRKKLISRSEAYSLFSVWINKPKNLSHIALLNKEECLLFLSKVKEYRGFKY